jgi:tetratricopeptide (TPR) repeat protein
MVTAWRAVSIIVLAITGQAQEQVCNSSISEPLEREGSRAMSNRAFDPAAQFFLEAFEACPSKRSILLSLAQAQISGRKFDAAIRTAKLYVDGEKASVEGHLILANAYFMAERLKEALAESEMILRDHPAEAAALKIRANASYLLGEFGMAKDTLIRLLDRHPEDEDGAYMLGRIYYQEGYTDLAIGQFERVVAINPKSYKALDNLGLCYQANGDDEKATRYFLAAIKLVDRNYPEYEWPYTNLADLLLKNGDAQRAFNAASKAVNRNPMSARSFYIGAKALDRLEKPELALNWLQRAVALNESFPDAWYFLAHVHRELNQTAKAEEALQKFRETKAKEPAHRR